MPYEQIDTDAGARWRFVPMIAGNSPKAAPLMGKDPIRMDDADFKESDHPRDEDGKFSEGGGGGAKQAAARPTQTAKIVEGKHVAAAGKPLPAHVASLKIPPAWTDVKYTDDPDAALLVTGKDAKGRVVSIYSAEHTSKQAAVKFARIAELIQEFDDIKRQNDQARRDPAKRDVADCLDLIMSTGIRPGSDTDTGAKVKAYGASTLEGRHVRSQGGQVFLDFTGKKGVALSIPVQDEKLASRLLQRKEKAGPSGRLFGDVTHASLLAHTHSMDGGSFRPKDMRTRLGTTLGASLVRSSAAPTTPVEYKKAVMMVAATVAKKLGNTPAVSLQSYINPAIFTEWRQSAGI